MISLKNKIATFTAATVLSAGALLAAVPPNNGHIAMHHRGFMAGRIANNLGLSDTQKAQAKAIWQNASQTAKPIRQQLRQERQSVMTAVKAGESDQQIQQLASAEGPQLAQLAAIRASAFAKFYAMLTPEQQQKLN